MKYGDVIEYLGHLHAVCNIDSHGVWLISLEHRDAIPFLAFPIVKRLAKDVPA